MNEITELVGSSRNIEHVKELIYKIAEVETNTLVCGETGVGKDLIVQTLYNINLKNKFLLTGGEKS